MTHDDIARTRQRIRHRLDTTPLAPLPEPSSPSRFGVGWMLLLVPTLIIAAVIWGI